MLLIKTGQVLLQAWGTGVEWLEAENQTKTKDEAGRQAAAVKCLSTKEVAFRSSLFSSVRGIFSVVLEKVRGKRFRRKKKLVFVIIYY